MIVKCNINQRFRIEMDIQIAARNEGEVSHTVDE